MRKSTVPIKKDVAEYGFLRVATAVPRVNVGDVVANTQAVISCFREATAQGAGLTVFPEMSLTGYTLGDLFHQELLQRKTVDALIRLRDETKGKPGVLLVGLPLAADGKLFNVAAIVGDGKIWGIVPKLYIPGYKEFYEERWFSSARDLQLKEIIIGGETVPIGADMLFAFPDTRGLVVGVEICEDMWMPLPPSSFQAVAGATLILNPSASNELVGKADYRKQLVVQQSARGVCGYVYASCGVHESTTDVVFSGHAIIVENGGLLAESQRFAREKQITYADIDLDHIASDRLKLTSFAEGVHASEKSFRRIAVTVKLPAVAELRRVINRDPFVPGAFEDRRKVSEEIFNIQAAGLAKRLEHAGFNRMVIGLSGGLDSTLALLVAVKAAELLKIPRANIFTYTMPGFGTTSRTKNNALALAKALGVKLETIGITKGVSQQLADIEHDEQTEDITFENAQARYRTLTLMNLANQLHAIVVGTGDLSETALGWCTFTGDHISHYHVNSGVPKTLVRYLVEWVSETKEFKAAKKVLRDILATPISPELTRSKKGKIAQKTEDIVGPYELHDFFLYHFVRWGSAPKKILFLAREAFGERYGDDEIKKWLTLFIKRFFGAQWKRSVMPDGPKVGSVALSPRGDWRMPSDAEVTLWLEELK